MHGNGRRRGVRLAGDVEDRRRFLDAVVDEGRRRALEKRQLHLVRDGLELVAQHLQENGIEGWPARHGTLLMRRFPESSTLLMRGVPESSTLLMRRFPEPSTVAA